jgi:hypothetical protein
MFNSTPELDINLQLSESQFYTIVEGTIDLVKINRTDNIVKVTKVAWLN